MEEQLQIPQVEESLLPQFGVEALRAQSVHSVDQGMPIEHSAGSHGDLVVETLQRCESLLGPLDDGAASLDAGGCAPGSADEVHEQRDLVGWARKKRQAVQVAETNCDAALLTEKSCPGRWQTPSPGEELVMLSLADGAGREVVAGSAEVSCQDTIRRHQQEIRSRVQRELRWSGCALEVQTALDVGDSRSKGPAVRQLEEEAPHDASGPHGSEGMTHDGRGGGTPHDSWEGQAMRALD
jgi:hypothetical protein